MVKSKIFGFNACPAEVEVVARSLGCSTASLPFTYLGLPVGAAMSRISHWSPIIDKFRSKLSKWKAKSLSFGGRLTLCKSVLGSLGLYFFSLFKAPAKVIQVLEQLRMRFFWGGDLDTRKTAWVAWDKALAAHDRGGIGIGSLKGQNLALISKWYWKFRTTNPEVLWVKVISAIHGTDGGFSAPSTVKRKSPVWGAIANLPNVMLKSNIEFRSFLVRDPNQRNNRGWTWSLDPNNEFTVSSFRSYIDRISLPLTTNSWSWNHLVPGKINILMWRLSKGRLPTFENLVKMGIGSNQRCRACSADSENESHIFVDCIVAKETWSLLSSWWRALPASISNVSDILKCKESGQVSRALKLFHEAVVLVFVWVIWSQRNHLVHNGSSKTPTLLVNEIQVLTHLWLNARKRKGAPLRWNLWCIDPITECSIVGV